MSGQTIAIVGAGPSGCFLAQALRRALPLAAIDILDRLPTPFGLVRYGVAPDHQGTKAVTRQFERLFERENVGFLGGVEIGDRLSLTDLRAIYDIVVLATGLSGDRRLGVPGEKLAGMIGSGRLTRWINDHPDEADFSPALGHRVAIIGNGNVALDLARMLTKQAAEFAGSDLSPARARELGRAEIREITVIGRGAPSAARFDAALLREFAKLAEAHVRVEMPAGVAAPSDNADGAAQYAALAALDGTGAPAHLARRRLTFRFNLAPSAVLGQQCVEGLRLTGTGADRSEVNLPVDTVITAIGFEDSPTAPLKRGAFIASGKPPTRLDDGLFATGWFRRGPRGTIPDNRLDAKQLAEVIAAETASLAGKPGQAALVARLADAPLWRYADWAAMRETETRLAPAGRVRLKLANWNDLRAALAAPARAVAS